MEVRAAMLALILADPHSAIPNLGASGAISAVMGAFLVTYPHQIRADLFIFIFVFCADHIHPDGLLIVLWFLSQLFHAGPWHSAEG